MRATPWVLVSLALAGLHCGGSERQPGDPGGQPDAGNPTQECTGQLMPAFVDADGDGHGGASTTVCIPPGPSMLPAGYAWIGGDCDDRDLTRWTEKQLYVDSDRDGVHTGELVTVCAGDTAPAGYVAFGPGGDCAPSDPAKWQMLFYTYRDADGDGFTVASPGEMCSSSSLPAGYSNEPTGEDCDEADRWGWTLMAGYEDTDGDRFGSGPLLSVCSDGIILPSGYAATAGDCAPDDRGRWYVSYYYYRDADGDGFTVYGGDACTGTEPPLGGYTNSTRGYDCDDSDYAVWASLTGYADTDHDGFGGGTAQQFCTRGSLPTGYISNGTDCEPDDANRWRSYGYTYRDSDGDGYTVAETGTLCIGLQAPPGYGTVRNGDDCDDANPAVHATVYAYADADTDGIGAGQVERFCTDGSLPAGYSLQGTDCDAGDPGRWQMLSYKYADRDGDGHTAPEAGSVCTGSTLPDPYRAAANGNDCDEADPDLYRWVVLYRDQDGDGVGAGPRSVFCRGASLPEGWSVFGWDPNDQDPGLQSVPAEERELFSLF